MVLWREIDAGNMTSGALVACVLLSARVMAPLGQVAALLVRYDQTKLAFNALHQLMKAPEERPPEKKLVHKPHLDGAIEFKEVTFTYPGEDVPAVNGLSFRIAAGAPWVRFSRTVPWNRIVSCGT